MKHENLSKFDDLDQPNPYMWRAVSKETNTSLEKDMLVSFSYVSKILSKISKLKMVY
jgi:hypothetical protein